MGLFDRSRTTQTTNQFVEQTEVGISELGAGAIGFAGGNVSVVNTDAGAIALANELAGTSVEAVSSVASQALTSQQKAQFDALKASGMSFQAALLAIGASQEESARLAELAIFRVSEANNPAVAAPSTFTPGNIETIVKYGAALLAIVAAVFFLRKG